MKPDDRLMAWKAETAISRLDGCIAMLHLHDFLTDAEVRKVRARIRKWKDRKWIVVGAEKDGRLAAKKRIRAPRT